jgi:hypothetical protein
MEAICSSETSVANQQTARRHIPEDDTLYNHRCENLKSYTRKCIRNVYVSYWIYKNSSKWDPPCSMHNAQRCDTVLQIDWQV